MLDLANLLGVGEDPTLAVDHEAVRVPASLPQFEGEVDMVGRDLVAFVVLGHRQPEQAGGGILARTGDDVPADASVRHVIERCHLARDHRGFLDGGRQRCDEAQPLRHGGERGQDHRGIGFRKLDATA